MNIELISEDGDNDINLGIKKKLRIHKNLNSELIKLKLETKYTKVDLSKSDKGEIQNYQLNAVAMIYINKSNSTKTIEIKESFTMENFAANDNVLNEVLDDFNALYYYSYLREELSIKEAVDEVFAYVKTKI